MKSSKMKRFSKLLSIVASVTVLVSPISASAFQSTEKEYPLAEDIQYKQYKYYDGGQQFINHIAVDVIPGKTEVQIGLPTRANAKETTTSLATKYSKEGNRVAGAINAGFFNMSEGFPLFLLAYKNKIVNGGVVSKGSDEYLNVPTAFGIDAKGNGLIDYFDFKVNLTSGGITNEMSGMNRQRNIYESIIYTPQFYKNYTDTNEYGFEIVIDTGEEITSNYFGQTLTGKVTQIKEYGSKEHLTIPKTGFVVSLQGSEWYNKYKHIQVGDEMTANFQIDPKWHNAEYIIASGPMLVKDSKPYVMMSASSPRARELAPRTIVATSNGGKKVHLITVDGRQSHSKGMNMTQLANYLVKLGMESAINLDGGGSTTMALRDRLTYDHQIKVANLPSNAGNAQRQVSTILQAVSKEPTSEASKAWLKIENDIPLLTGASTTINVSAVFDKNYNRLPHDKAITLTSEKGTLEINGTTYKATVEGEDRIFVYHNGTQINSFPVNTVGAPTTMAIQPNATTLNEGQQIKFNVVNVVGKDGKPIHYDETQIEWSTTGGIGGVANNGTFTAGTSGTSGQVIAKLGDKQVAANVIIKKLGLFTDIPAGYMYEKELDYLTTNKIINGYGDGSFKPDNALSRQHAALILSKVLKLNTSDVSNPNFADVPTTHMYYKEIAALSNAGIISGVGGKFNPEGTLTRAQMAKMISIGFALEAGQADSFTDVTSDDWYYEYVQRMAAKKITTGYGDGSFKPLAPITRMHFGLFVYKALMMEK